MGDDTAGGSCIGQAGHDFERLRTAGALLRTFLMRSVTNCGSAEPWRPAPRPAWAAAAPAAEVLASCPCEACPVARGDVGGEADAELAPDAAAAHKISVAIKFTTLQMLHA